MKRRRVKITGIGFVTPAGIGIEAFEAGILESVSRVGPITRFPEEGGAFVGAEVKKFRLGDFVPDAASKRMPRHTQFALAATVMALRDAGIEKDTLKHHSLSIVIGASLMDSEVVNKTIEEVTRKGPRFGLARVVFHGPVSTIGTMVAEMLGTGRTMTLQSACCAGSDAIGHAAQMIASGESDLAICGGTEAPLQYHPMLELRIAGLSPDTTERPGQLCRPFDRWRTTGVIGEGACVMVLEPESSPRPGYAFVDGYAFATDRSGYLNGGLHESIRLGLANAGVRPEGVDHISTWGPGHREIDAAEAGVLRRIFGAKLDHIPATSIKGAIGNPLGAAGAIQVGCAALGMRRAFIPPTVNWTHPDPACALNLSARARFLRFNTALIDAHGLSGTNSCLLLRRCE